MSNRHSSDIVRCPACHAQNRRESVSCVACHESLFDLKIESREPENENDGPDSRGLTVKSASQENGDIDCRCRGCGHVLARDDTDCPECGLFVEEWARPAPREPKSTREPASGYALVLRCCSSGTRFVVASGDVVGREAKGAAALHSHDTVSRRHCRIAWDPERTCWTLMDLGSANGTSVGDMELEPGVSFPIALGDRVRLGQSLFALEVAGSEDDAVPGNSS